MKACPLATAGHSAATGQLPIAVQGLVRTAEQTADHVGAGSYCSLLATWVGVCGAHTWSETQPNIDAAPLKRPLNYRTFFIGSCDFICLSSDGTRHRLVPRLGRKARMGVRRLSAVWGAVQNLRRQWYSHQQLGHRCDARLNLSRPRSAPRSQSAPHERRT